MSTALSDAKAVCLRYIEIMTNGSIEDFETVVHPDAANRQASKESLACRGRGLLAATVSEDEGVVLTAAVRERRRPPPWGSGRGLGGDVGGVMLTVSS